MTGAGKLNAMLIVPKLMTTRATFRVHYFNRATGTDGKTDVLSQPGENTDELKRRFQAAFPSCQVTKIKVVR